MTVPAPKAKGSSSCLKIFLFGCLFLVVASVVLFAAGGYFVKRYVADVIGTEESSYGTRAKDLRRRFPFEAKADGRITDDQLARFLKVAERFTQVIGSEDWKRRQEELQKSPSPYIDGFRFWLQFGDKMRKTMMESLEENRMSLEEYQYVHKCALKTWAASYREQAGRLLEQQQPQEQQQPAPEMPEEVRRLLDDVATVPSENLVVLRNRQSDVEKFLPAAPFAKMLFPLLVDPDKDSLF